MFYELYSMTIRAMKTPQKKCVQIDNKIDHIITMVWAAIKL